MAKDLKVKKYKEIVTKVLEGHLFLPSSQMPGIQDKLIINEDSSHFIQLTFGWNNEDYIHQTVFHLEVKLNGQVWVHENRSDILIDDELTNAGIATEDIILSLIEPYSDNTLDMQVA